MATRTASLICNRRNVLSFSGVARVADSSSIPISRFYASLDAYDLKLSLSTGSLRHRRSITPTKRSSHGHPVAPEEFIVQLDVGGLLRKPLAFSHSSGGKRGYDA